MGIPSSYCGEDYILDRFDENHNQSQWNPAIVPIIRNSAMNRTNICLFSDITGTAKTRLMIGWLLELRQHDTFVKKNPFGESVGLEARDPVKYRFIDCRSNSIFNAGGYKSAEQVGKICHRARAIVLDDIMQERQAAAQSYSEIINHCFSHGIPLAMTMNATIDEFKERYDLSIYRRFIDNKGKFIDVNKMRGF